MTARMMPGPGARVSVRAGEWQSSPGNPGHTDHVVVIVSVHESHDPAYAWVYGHGPDCAWESADCTAPFCFEMLIDVDVLATAVAGQRA
ncbi:hypothetical protein [Micromonospora sp. U21]|uniref:hypothetical protein n=1 Tax=Micromonospora sp. U21 TaxID=2824899 RepID=UPI001B390CED|nr:hypothetical protein [Micromonospora sp. U21]MBQ0906962.1 hypothetical protein [Micromonospora sp. U21]